MDDAPPPAGRTGPPRYVPTLTQVVQPGPGVEAVPTAVAWVPAPVSAAMPDSWPASAPAAPLPAPPDDEERLLRVLQRVEVLLDRRLSAAVAQAADSVSRELVSRLKAEIEPLIREAVGEAVAEELNPGNHPPL